MLKVVWHAWVFMVWFHMFFCTHVMCAIMLWNYLIKIQVLAAVLLLLAAGQAFLSQPERTTASKRPWTVDNFRSESVWCFWMLLYCTVFHLQRFVAIGYLHLLCQPCSNCNMLHFRHHCKFCKWTFFFWDDLKIKKSWNEWNQWYNVFQNATEHELSSRNQQNRRPVSGAKSLGRREGLLLGLAPLVEAICDMFCSPFLGVESFYIGK